MKVGSGLKLENNTDSPGCTCLLPICLANLVLGGCYRCQWMQCSTAVLYHSRRNSNDSRMMKDRNELLLGGRVMDVDFGVQFLTVWRRFDHQWDVVAAGGGPICWTPC